MVPEQVPDSLMVRRYERGRENHEFNPCRLGNFFLYVWIKQGVMIRIILNTHHHVNCGQEIDGQRLKWFFIEIGFST